MNGRTLRVIVDNYTGEGIYETSKYYFGHDLGDAIGIYAKAHEPYGEVIVQEVKDNIVKGEFIGMLISTDSSETFEINTSFEVVRDFD